jgi:hypothetical protein
MRACSARNSGNHVEKTYKREVPDATEVVGSGSSSEISTTLDLPFRLAGAFRFSFDRGSSSSSDDVVISFRCTLCWWECWMRWGDVTSRRRRRRGPREDGVNSPEQVVDARLLLQVVVVKLDVVEPVKMMVEASSKKGVNALG